MKRTATFLALLTTGALTAQVAPQFPIMVFVVMLVSVPVIAVVALFAWIVR